MILIKTNISNIYLMSCSIIGDIIIKEGTIGNKMYFIQEGVVDIVMANGEVYNEKYLISINFFIICFL